MVLEPITNAADQLQKLEMYPYFDIADCLLSTISVHEDLGGDAVNFSRKHPFACWMSTMMVIFASGIAANALLGEPILEPFVQTPILLIATAMWYITFYTPFDIGYKVGTFLPVKIVAYIFKEIYRVRKIDAGITHAAEKYPDALFVMLCIGTIKGNGALLTKLLDRLVRGLWTPGAIEFLNPSINTKISFVTSCIFIMESKTDLLYKVSHEVLILCWVSCLIAIQLSSILFCTQDPFKIIENSIGTILFGGICDYITKLLESFRSKSDVQSKMSCDKFDPCSNDFYMQENDFGKGQKRKYGKNRRI